MSKTREEYIFRSNLKYFVGYVATMITIVAVVAIILWDPILWTTGTVAILLWYIRYKIWK